MNRRTASKVIFGAALGGVLRAEGSAQVESGGGVIDVTLAGPGWDLPNQALLDWVKWSADAVTWYFGKFPVPKARLRVLVGRRGGVSNGTTWGTGGARTRIAVGPKATIADLKEYWILTHEMVHFGFPSVEEDHHWIEEGSAVYIEPIARVRTGQLSPERIWGDMVRDMPQGQPGSGDQGLNNTHTWARTYWGGAIFCMMADVEIRKRTKNKKGLQDAFRAINRAGGTVDVEWPLEKAFEIGDKAVGGKPLMELWQQMGPKPMTVDLGDLWKQLGVIREDGRVRFDKSAPLAAVRAAIA